jgi:hypothetical protein
MPRLWTIEYLDIFSVMTLIFPHSYIEVLLVLSLGEPNHLASHF